MRAGTASADITPLPGVELMGFALRDQPSSSVHDPLQARVLFLEEGNFRLLLVNVDLIGLSSATVNLIRRRVADTIPGIGGVMIFATHTHSGPGTAPLNGCGALNMPYLDKLMDLIPGLCLQAAGRTVECRMEAAGTSCRLAVNRRGGAEPGHRLGILRWVRSDGSIHAMLVTYAMHPVCLRSAMISADYPGEICRRLGEEVPGNPLVLFGLMPGGDLDPPGVGVTPGRMKEWGGQLVESVWKVDRFFPPASLGIIYKKMLVPVPDPGFSSPEISAYADRYLADDRWHAEFGPNFRRAVEAWRESRLRETESGSPPRQVELSIVRFGDLRLVFINAELFSDFGRLCAGMGEQTDRFTWVITCANGLEGYIPDEAAWKSGGYEIETAPFFYNMPPPVRGFLEELAGLITVD